MNLFYIIDTNLVIAFFLVMFFLYFRKLLPQKQHMIIALNISTLLIIAILISDVIIRYFTNVVDIDNFIEKFILKSFLTIQLACRAYYPVIWTLFLYTYQNKKKKLSILNLINMCFVSHIFLILLLTTPLTGLVFKIGEASNIIVQGPLYTAPLYINVLYLASCLIYILLSKKTLTSQEMNTLLFACLVPSVGAILELQFQEIFFTSTTSAISIIFIYILLQEFITDYDYNTTALSRIKFESLIDTKRTDKNKDFTIIYFILDNYRELINLESTLPIEKISDLSHDFSKLITASSNKNDSLGVINLDKYALCAESTDIEYITKILNTLNTKVHDYNENKDLNLKYTYSYIRYNETYDDNNNLLKAAYIKTYTTQKEKYNKLANKTEGV